MNKEKRECKQCGEVKKIGLFPYSVNCERVVICANCITEQPTKVINQKLNELGLRACYVCKDVKKLQNFVADNWTCNECRKELAGKRAHDNKTNDMIIQGLRDGLIKASFKNELTLSLDKSKYKYLSDSLCKD